MSSTSEGRARQAASESKESAAVAKTYANKASQAEDFSNQAQAAAEAAVAASALASDASTSSASSESNAEAAAAAATASAQNATITANVYPTLADAQAAIADGTIPDGAMFNVAVPAGSMPPRFADQYQNVAGVATSTGVMYPSAESVTAVAKQIDIVQYNNASSIEGLANVAEVAIDSVGNMTMRRLADGTTQFPALMVGHKIEQVQSTNGSVFQSRNTGDQILSMTETGGINMLSYEAFLSTAYPDYAEIYADQFGNIFKIVDRTGKVTDICDGSALTDPIVSADGGLGIEESGNIYFVTVDGDNTALTTDGGNINPVTFKATDDDYFIKFASKEGGSGNYKLHRIAANGLSRIKQGSGKLIHIMLVGQSLSVGRASIVQPAVTVTPRYPYGAVTFNGGPKYDSSLPTESVEESDLQYLVSMVENIGKSGGHESDCSGLAERLFEKNGVTCMASATGSSGKTLAEISVGTDSFKATQLVMRRAHEIATSLGMVYTPALLFIHGNANAVAGTSGSVYKDGMIKLRDDYESYYKTLTFDEGSTLPMFVQQFSNANVQAGTAGAEVNLIIGNAQYEICRDDPNFIITGTQYARPYVDKDHLSNNGYRTDGEVAGVSIAEYFKTQSVLALRPDESNITQTTTEVTIPLAGGIGAAVIDTVRVSDPGNYGFRLEGATISSVTIDASNVVHIAKTGTATAVSYAYVGIRGANPGVTTGSRGCVRDSATDVSPVSLLPIYNDLVAFCKTLGGSDDINYPYLH